VALIPQTGYRALPALNASYLKQILSRSKWHADVPFEPTAAMRLGTLVHSCILEPDTVDHHYEVFEGDRRTKAGKEAYAHLLESGKEIVSAKDMDIAVAMMTSAFSHDEIGSLLGNAQFVEQSMTFDYHGLDAKAQIDLYTKDGVLVDLKTVSDIYQAEKQFFNMHYALQMAWYKLALEGNDLPVNEVKILFVETQAPHQCALFSLTEPVLLHGLREAADAVDKYLAQRELVHPELINGSLALPPWLNKEEKD